MAGWFWWYPLRKQRDEDVLTLARRRLQAHARLRPLFLFMWVGYPAMLLGMGYLALSLAYRPSGWSGTGSSLLVPWSVLLVMVTAAMGPFWLVVVCERANLGTGTGVLTTREDEMLVAAWDALAEAGQPPPLAAANWRPLPPWVRRWSDWWPWLSDPAGYVQQVRRNLAFRKAHRPWVLALSLLGVAGVGIGYTILFPDNPELTIETLNRWGQTIGLNVPFAELYPTFLMSWFAGVHSGVALTMVNFHVGGSRRDRLLLACGKAAERLKQTREGKDHPAASSSLPSCRASAEPIRCSESPPPRSSGCATE